MFMCVGTMDGYSGRGYSSSKDLAIWPSAFEDELDIVGRLLWMRVQINIIWIYLRLPHYSVPLLSVQVFQELSG